MRPVAFFVTAAALALACGESSADACARYFEALVACEAPAITFDAAEHDREKARFVASCEGRMQLPGTSFSASWVSACADAIPSAGCVPIALDYGACATKPGSLPEGAPCEDGAQCASTFCDNYATPCGHCAKSVPEGGDCGSLPPVPCVAGTMCIAGTCTRPTFAAAGESCDDTTTFCQKDLVCVAQTCSAPLGLGETCFRYVDCAAGLRCSEATPQGGTCVADPAPTFADPGASCSPITPCAVGECDSSGTCPEPIADGQPCSATSGSPCDAFAKCVDGTCQSSGYACP